MPKAVSRAHMEENLAAASVVLSDDDVAALDGLRIPEGSVGQDPTTFTSPQTREDMARRIGI